MGWKGRVEENWVVGTMVEWFQKVFSILEYLQKGSGFQCSEENWIEEGVVDEYKKEMMLIQQKEKK